MNENQNIGSLQCEPLERNTANDLIVGIKNRFHFLDALVISHENKSKLPFSRPGLLNSVNSQEIRKFLECRHSQVLHNNKLPNSTPPLTISGGGDVQPLVLQNRQPPHSHGQRDYMSRCADSLKDN